MFVLDYSRIVRNELYLLKLVYNCIRPEYYFASSELILLNIIYFSRTVIMFGKERGSGIADNHVIQTYI